jgi:thiamine transport system permease protein
MLVLIAFYSWTQRVLARQEEFQNTDTNRLPRHPRSLRVRFLVLCYALCTVIFVLGPIAGIVVRSFMAPATRGGNLSFTLKWYRQLFGVATQSGSILGVAGSAIANSLVIATLTAGISLIVGTMTAASLRRSQGKTKTYLELLTMLPMAVSSVTIGLGYFLVTSFFTATKSFSYILVVLAHVVITLPFVLRSVLPEYRKIPFT